MKRFHSILVFAVMTAVPYAPAQTWDLGKDGSVTQKQTANNKGTKKQSTSEQPNPKAQAKVSNTDDDLKQQVNQKFGTDTALRYILVEVQNANVTLSGTVPTKADKKRAVHLAKAVAGVRKVHDSLTIDANASSSSDNEPTNARNSQPPKPKTTAATRTRTRPGPVSRSATENKSIAAADPAKSISAGGEVHIGSNSSAVGGGISGAAASASISSNSSSAGPDSGSVTRNTKATSTDFSAVPVPLMRPLTSTATLKGQIENALRNDSQVGSSNLSVNVTDTTIELAGNVPSGKERTAAYRIAQSFAFNRRVEDRMTVTGRGNAVANPATPSGNVGSGKPAVGSASTPNIPKSNAAGDGNAFNPR